jgi:hypothetical protein
MQPLLCTQMLVHSLQLCAAQALVKAHSRDVRRSSSVQSAARIDHQAKVCCSADTLFDGPDECSSLCMPAALELWMCMPQRHAV